MFPTHWAPVRTAPAPLGLRPSLQRPSPTQWMGAPGGHTWPQDLDSVPGLAWALGSWVKPGLLQTPAESRVSGAWETHLTHFSPGTSGCELGRPGSHGAWIQPPVSSLSCVCRTAGWDTAQWRTPGQPWSFTTSPGESRAVRAARLVVSALPKDQRPSSLQDCNSLAF